MASIELNPTPPKTKALASPAVDFWMLGGGSIIITIILMPLLHFFGALSPYIIGVSLAAGSLVINYPHFGFSYLLFYDGFLDRLQSPLTTMASKIRILTAGIAVPVSLILLLVISYQQKNADLLIFMMLASLALTGWHYSKQGYGVLITLSVYKKSFYSAREKFILYMNAYSMWIFSWALLANENYKKSGSLYGLELHILAVPKWIVLFLAFIASVSTGAALVVFAKRFLADRKNFPVNGMFAYIAGIYFWTVFLNRNAWGVLVFFAIIPVFHAVQYLFFVWKLKSREFSATQMVQEAGAQSVKKTKNRTFVSLMSFLLGGWFIGTFFIALLPLVDRVHFAAWGGGISFFGIASQIFINTHHFFMDSAYWRKDNQVVQKYLFKAEG